MRGDDLAKTTQLENPKTKHRNQRRCYGIDKKLTGMNTIGTEAFLKN